MSSGLFFMFVGTSFLLAGTFTVGKIHAGMTFIFVVVGVATLLYGTGTQATGSLDGSAPSSTFKLSLAGGAGALAFAAAAGIVFFQDRINLAFREETRFLEVIIPTRLDGQSNLEHYVAAAEVDGDAVPAAKQGNNHVLVLVPYTLTDTHKPKKLVLTLVWDKTQQIPTTLRDHFTTPAMDVDLAFRESSGGGTGLPQFTPHYTLDLTRATQIAVGTPDGASKSGPQADQVVIEAQ